MLSDISIEPFRGDIEGLEKMALSSWRDEYGISSFPNLYRPAFLRFLFDRLPDKRHLIAAYRGDEIVSFFANLPRRIHFEGDTYRAVLSCLLVTRKALLRHGMAQAIIAEALKLNQELNYDFALLYLETGHRSTKLIEKLAETGHAVDRVKKVYVIARILDLPRVLASEDLKGWERAALRLSGLHHLPKARAPVSLREYRPEDVDACLGLLDRHRGRARLALVWERDELAWELDYPDVSKTLVYEKEGEVRGLINFLYHEHHGKTIERWAWLNHVAFPELSGRERSAFIKAFLAYMKETGCVGVTEWTRGYYPMTPLYRARFFPYFRALNLHAWRFNPDLDLQNIRRVYEVQI